MTIILKIIYELLCYYFFLVRSLVIGENISLSCVFFFFFERQRFMCVLLLTLLAKYYLTAGYIMVLDMHNLGLRES